MKRFLLSLLMIAPIAMFANPSPSNTQNESQNTSSGYDYFSVENFDWMSYEYASAQDLYGLTNEQVDLVRNYIYAKHGYIFKTDYYRRYFSQFRWYRPRYKNVDNMLNKYEKKNVMFLRQWTKGR